MHPDHINLLPHERRRQIRVEYFYHLATVAFLMLTVLVIIHAALLLPTYQFLEKQVGIRTDSLAQLNQTLASSDEQSLAMRLTAVENKVDILVALSTSTPQIGVLRQVLAEPHPNVSLSGIILAPRRGKTPETVALSGVAATRDDLRAYYLELSTAPFIATANLPVSAYAAESNIAFTITLTLP